MCWNGVETLHRLPWPTEQEEVAMQSRGFEDVQAAYLADPRKLIGQVRRFGDAGPAYEVLALNEDGELVTEVVYSGEIVICTVKEVLDDPMAETIP
jgi:hypothetical protein